MTEQYVKKNVRRNDNRKKLACIVSRRVEWEETLKCSWERARVVESSLKQFEKNTTKFMLLFIKNEIHRTKHIKQNATYALWRTLNSYFYHLSSSAFCMRCYSAPALIFVLQTSCCCCFVRIYVAYQKIFELNSTFPPFSLIYFCSFLLFNTIFNSTRIFVHIINSH